MSKDYATHRADGDYALYRYEGEDTFTFKDKRTGHRYQFHECVENGFGNNVFLYYHPTVAPDDAGRTAGYKCGFLNKDSLPEWLIEEFEHIHHNGCATPASDPR